MKSQWILIFIPTLIFGCQPTENSVDPMAMQITLSNNWESFIKKWEAEDAIGCADFYSAEGINIGPENDILKGREAIAKFYDFLFPRNIRYLLLMKLPRGYKKNLMKNVTL